MQNSEESSQAYRITYNELQEILYAESIGFDDIHLSALDKSEIEIGFNVARTRVMEFIQTNQADAVGRVIDREKLIEWLTDKNEELKISSYGMDSEILANISKGLELCFEKLLNLMQAG